MKGIEVAEVMFSKWMNDNNIAFELDKQDRIITFTTHSAMLSDNMISKARSIAINNGLDSVVIENCYKEGDHRFYSVAVSFVIPNDNISNN